MLKSRAANDQSVQTTTWAICGTRLTFVMVNRVVRAVAAGDLKSTSKNGNSSVAAGAVLMSHASSLFVVVGPEAMPGVPNANVAFGVTSPSLPAPAANAEPAMRREAARTISFYILFSYTSLLRTTDSNGHESPSLDDTITSRAGFFDLYSRFQFR